MKICSFLNLHTQPVPPQGNSRPPPRPQSEGVHTDTQCSSRLEESTWVDARAGLTKRRLKEHNKEIEDWNAECSWSTLWLVKAVKAKQSASNPAQESVFTVY